MKVHRSDDAMHRLLKWTELTFFSCPKCILRHALFDNIEIIVAIHATIPKMVFSFVPNFSIAPKIKSKATIASKTPIIIAAICSARPCPNG